MRPSLHLLAYSATLCLFSSLTLPELFRPSYGYEPAGTTKLEDKGPDFELETIDYF